jgi:hypothetical protein
LRPEGEGSREPYDPRTQDALESLIESFVEQMSQVFMLPIFHCRTSC